MKASVIAVLLVCLGATTASAQQVYTWTDANGVKHFSDTPPPDPKAAKKLNVKGNVTSEADEETAQTESKEGPKLAASAGYSEEDIKRNCEVARKNVEIHERSRPADDADPDLKVRYQENLGKAQNQVKLFCG
jgi:hypothetical protein